MKRRKFIALLGVAVMAWPLVAHAQEPKKIPHLCFLTFDPGTLQSSPRFDVFFNSLRDLGYVDGQTIVIDYLSADGKDDRFPACFRMFAAQGGRNRREYDSCGSGREEGNPHGSNCHDSAWRSRWDWPCRKHNPTGGKRYRYVSNGSRACCEAS